MSSQRILHGYIQLAKRNAEACKLLIKAHGGGYAVFKVRSPVPMATFVERADAEMFVFFRSDPCLGDWR